MPYPQPAPAAPGNQVPIQVPPSLRRPPPENLPRTPRPINGRRRFSSLVSKLHSWELEHLRAHCAELQAENERLQQDGPAYQEPAWTRLSRRVGPGFPAHWWVTEHRWDQAGREWMRSYPAVVDDFGDIVEVVG